MLTLLAAPFLFFVCFLVQQKVQQHHMLEKLEHASLQTISINQADVIWVKKNKEVLINGELFDVKSYSLHNDKVILIGLYDKEEDALKKDYANRLQSDKNQSTPINELVLKFVFAYAIIEQNTPPSQLVPTNKENNFYCFSQDSINQFLSVSTPPPNA
jgi:hypothetical protein